MSYPLPPAIVIENMLTAVIIVAYLFYEVRFGRGARFSHKLEGLIEVTVALARENPDIDDEAVADRLNGDTPSQFVEDDD